MMSSIIEYAPIVGLLFFFIIFIAIAIWAFRPGAKSTFQQLGMIPLKEDIHG